MTQPIFLVAARRSGTTLFRLMLDEHPDVMWHRGWEHVADAIATLDADPNKPVTVKVGNFDSVTATTLPDLRSKLESEASEALGKKGKHVFGATVHVNFKTMLDIWPDAKFVHLIRDPRDVAISFLKLGWAKHAYYSMNGWEIAEREWDAMRSNLKSDQFIDISYEALVSEPRAELQRVCDFIGVAYTDKLFNYVETSTYSMPKKSFAHRWKTHLDKEEVRQMESGRHEFMRSRGYEPACENTEYTGWQKFCFAQIGSFRHRKRRIKEEGVVYIVAARLARWLKIGFLTTWVTKVADERHKKRLAMLEKNY